jgi:hypothetical protein
MIGCLVKIGTESTHERPLKGAEEKRDYILILNHRRKRLG